MTGLLAVLVLCLGIYLVMKFVLKNPDIPIPTQMTKEEEKKEEKDGGTDSKKTEESTNTEG